jgi:hypothetical protein
MNKIQDIKLDFLKQINNVMPFFEQGCEQRKLSSKARDWHIVQSTQANMFAFDYSKDSTNAKLKGDQKRFGKIYAGFVSNEPRFWIDLTRVAFSDIRNMEGFLAELIQLAWSSRDVTKEQFDELLNRYVVVHGKEIADALSNWIYSSNFEKSSKYGGRLYRYRQYIPENLKQSPSNTLFRAMEIDQSLFDKIISGQKKYIELKNRMYSSWSYNLLATKAFGESFEYEAAQKKQIIIILRKTFTPNQIFLNIEKAARYFGVKSTYSEDEFEIIIRTSQNFKFIFKDIYSYLDHEKSVWRKILGGINAKVVKSAFYKTLTVTNLSTRKPVNVEIFKNPSSSDIKDIALQTVSVSPRPIVRFLADANKKVVYVWDGAAALHDQVKPSLDLSKYSILAGTAFIVGSKLRFVDSNLSAADWKWLDTYISGTSAGLERQF